MDDTKIKEAMAWLKIAGTSDSNYGILYRHILEQYEKLKELHVALARVKELEHMMTIIDWHYAHQGFAPDSIAREYIAKGKPTDQGQVKKETWKHVKRGSVYTEIGRGKIQTDTPLQDYDEVVVYQDSEESIWVRPVSEFEDGRFVAIDKIEE